MYPVGEIDDESKHLIKTTREALDASIAICKPGVAFREIGKVMCVFHNVCVFLSPLIRRMAFRCPAPVNQLQKRTDALSFVITLDMASISSSMAPRISPITLRIKLLGR